MALYKLTKILKHAIHLLNP